MRTRAALVLALLTAGATGAAAPAGAALPFAPCTPAGYECATLRVPLDRSGRVPGTTRLAIKRVRASANVSRSAVVALAGGPGQAAVPIAADFAEALAPALADRDLVVFDQRGIGASSPVSCPSLETGGDVRATVACTGRLGAARGLYRTTDSVADLEAIRAAAGYSRLVLYAVSYGTKLAEAYASAHPDRVERLVLDSVVRPDGPDVFRRSSFAAIPRVLRDLCRTGCRSFTRSPSADLTALARKLRVHPLRGTVVDGRGHRVRAPAVGDGALFDTLLGGDLNPALRSELPGAVRSALRKDARPLLRLYSRAQGLGIGDQEQGGVNLAIFRATTCEEIALPWPRSSRSAAERLRAAARAALGLSPQTVAPFGRATALTAGLVPECLGWLAASPPPAAPGPLPAVPTLLLEGGGDLRTPVEDASRVAAQVPGSQMLVVPRTGHSVLGADLTDCSRTALAAFFADRPIAACAAASTTFAPAPPPPTRLSRVPVSAGLHGTVGRTFTAVRLTVRDARLEAIGVGIAQDHLPSRIGGLRAGYALVDPNGLRFRGASYVPGVTISGTVPDRGAATITVRGAAAAIGTLHVSTGGKVTGRLGGRRVATSLAARALAPPKPRRPGPLARIR